MASFQTKIGWKQMRKREIKIIVPFRSVPTRCVIENSMKIVKNSKNKRNTIMAHFKPKQVGKGREKQKIKIIGPFRSYPTHNRKFQKKQQKN